MAAATVADNANSDTLRPADVTPARLQKLAMKRLRTAAIFGELFFCTGGPAFFVRATRSAIPCDIPCAGRPMVPKRWAAGMSTPSANWRG